MATIVASLRGRGLVLLNVLSAATAIAAGGAGTDRAPASGQLNPNLGRVGPRRGRRDRFRLFLGQNFVITRGVTQEVAPVHRRLFFGRRRGSLRRDLGDGQLGPSRNHELFVVFVIEFDLVGGVGWFLDKGRDVRPGGGRGGACHRRVERRRRQVVEHSGRVGPGAVS